MRRMSFLPLLVGIALAACGGDEIIEPDPREIAFDASLDIDIARMTETSSGLFYEDVTVGTGEIATAGRSLSVLYSGWLPNGTLFDSSDGVPINFVLGVSNLIAGWHEGLAGVRVGGVRKLVIPPSLGYPNGRGIIPPNSVIVFRVELVGVE